MDRRRFLEMMGGVGAASLALPHMPGRFVSAQPAPDAPNVLFIILEDVPDWIGCLGGHPDTLTPNIDQLAGRGVLFTNAHCSSPLCNPSRTSLFTGLRPSTTGVYFNNIDWRDVVPATHPTIPRHFHESGYQTIRSGKIYHASYDEAPAWDFAFNGWRDHTLGGHEPYTPNHPHAGVNFEIEGDNFFNWGATDEPVSKMSDMRRVRYVNNLIQNNTLREPFFIGFGTNKTHFPAIVPRRILEKFDPSQITLPPVLESDLDDLPPRALEFPRPHYHNAVVEGKQWHKAVAAYLASIHFMDEIVGRLMNQFDQSPYRDNTIVVLCADHGFHLGEKLHWRKATLWNESTQVILTVTAPSVTSPGTVCHEPVSLLDLYPTLVDLCGLDPVPGIEGTSLVPQLQDPATPRPQPAICTMSEGCHAVIDTRWRYIQYNTGDEELYDRWNDPNEWTNLAPLPEYTGVKEDLASWLPPGSTGRFPTFNH